MLRQRVQPDAVAFRVGDVGKRTQGLGHAGSFVWGDRSPHAARAVLTTWCQWAGQRPGAEAARPGIGTTTLWPPWSTVMLPSGPIVMFCFSAALIASRCVSPSVWLR